MHRAFVQGLLVQHDVGFDDAAAGGASRHAVVGLRAKGQQVVYRVGCAARHAEVAQHAAVQFEHVLAARFLMEAVDVLRHHGGQRARLLEFGQLAMRAVRLRVERQHAVAVEVEERAGVGVEEAAADHLLGRIGVLLRVQAVRAAEIGDAALGGHACAAEEHQAARRRVGHPAAERFDSAHGFVHSSSCRFRPMIPRFLRPDVSRETCVLIGLFCS